MHLKLEFLQLIHDFAAIRASVYIFLFFFVWLEKRFRDQVLCRALFSLSSEDKRTDLIPVPPRLLWALMSSTQIRLYVQ